MASKDPAERALIARIAAHTSWSRTEDRAARTAAGRRARDEKFLREVDPDGVLPEAERERRAEHARKAYFRQLARRSAAVRRARRTDNQTAAARARAELAERRTEGGDAA